MAIKAIFAHPNNGYEHEQAEAKGKGLIEGKEYVLKDANVGGFSTSVQLEGVEGRFNSVQFDFRNEDGTEADIYHMPEFACYHCGG